MYLFFNLGGLQGLFSILLNKKNKKTFLKFSFSTSNNLMMKNEKKKLKHQNEIEISVRILFDLVMSKCNTKLQGENWGDLAWQCQDKWKQVDRKKQSARRKKKLDKKSKKLEKDTRHCYRKPAVNLKSGTWWECGSLFSDCFWRMDSFINARMWTGDITCTGSDCVATSVFDCQQAARALTQLLTGMRTRKCYTFARPVMNSRGEHFNWPYTM